VEINNFYGESLEVNQVDEIYIKSDEVTHGYLKDKDDNLKLFTLEEYLRTGNADNFNEDGLFYIVSR
jgi:long-subunit acyl-CoA synthetase (AMP-forming)